MRKFLWTATGTAAAVASLMLTSAAPANAIDVDPGPHPWSTSLETANAAGQRHFEGNFWAAWGAELFVTGTLSNSGQGCYSAWTMTTDDMMPGFLTKRGEICGPGSVDIGFTTSPYDFMVNVDMTICKGTAYSAANCARWTPLTSWPVIED